MVVQVCNILIWLIPHIFPLLNSITKWSVCLSLKLSIPYQRMDIYTMQDTGQSEFLEPKLFVGMSSRYYWFLHGFVPSGIFIFCLRGLLRRVNIYIYIYGLRQKKKITGESPKETRPNWCEKIESWSIDYEKCKTKVPFGMVVSL